MNVSCVLYCSLGLKCDFLVTDRSYRLRQKLPRCASIIFPRWISTFTFRIEFKIFFYYLTSSFLWHSIHLSRTLFLSLHISPSPYICLLLYLHLSQVHSKHTPSHFSPTLRRWMYIRVSGFPTIHKKFSPSHPKCVGPMVATSAHCNNIDNRYVQLSSSLLSNSPYDIQPLPHINIATLKYVIQLYLSSILPPPKYSVSYGLTPCCRERPVVYVVIRYPVCTFWGEKRRT